MKEVTGIIQNVEYVINDINNKPELFIELYLPLGGAIHIVTNYDLSIDYCDGEENEFMDKMIEELLKIYNVKYLEELEDQNVICFVNNNFLNQPGDKVYGLRFNGPCIFVGNDGENIKYRKSEMIVATRINERRHKYHV